MTAFFRSKKGGMAGCKMRSKMVEWKLGVAAEEEEEEDAEELEVDGFEEEDEKQIRAKRPLQEEPAKIVPTSGFNVVLTHCTADFDSLASAVGLAKLWSSQNGAAGGDQSNFDSGSHLPTFVVLPRGAHPSVQRFLALHKHLFPIRSLKSLPDDLSGLIRLGLVDAQRRDRIGPAEHLLDHATRITVVDHHLDSDSDIPASDLRPRHGRVRLHLDCRAAHGSSTRRRTHQSGSHPAVGLGDSCRYGLALL